KPERPEKLQLFKKLSRSESVICLAAMKQRPLLELMAAIFVLFLMTALKTTGLAATLNPPNAQAPQKLPPDERYKCDILVIVAHPDDETEIAGYLARAIFDQHKRVAVVIGTRGNSGGNIAGYEQAAALGAVREIEARRALAEFGVTNIWFLGAPDTPGQDVLRSLETWNHGASLDQVVRIVRLTRPEVILTWLPDYVVGENHDDHQAASVLANEAFDMAGDPTAFPEQVAAPRNHASIGNLTEGLQPWQPKKIYYFSDASHTEFMEARGPAYSITEISPSRHVAYNQLIAVEASQHLTQLGVGLVARQALAKGDFHALEKPIQFVLGKSLVKCSTTGDIFEGVAAAPIPFAAIPGYRPESVSGVEIELGGPWAFYKLFWKAHNLEHLSTLLENEASVGSDGNISVPLLIHNYTDQPREVTLSATLPEGWTLRGMAERYPVGARDSYAIDAVVSAPPSAAKQWQKLVWNAELDGKAAGTVTLKVYVASGGLPQ
ncbi:MAG TPA: PIG-L family deacetylase, partial [Blastocatellia bacterium]|nr:PIG-L family deacetylase [Blastocatellia bacterium]